MAWFAVSMIGQIVHALRSYPLETLRQIAQTGLGTGAMALVGGAVGIGGFVVLSGASLIAVQGFASLGNIGVEAFTGYDPDQHNGTVEGLIVIALLATAPYWRSRRRGPNGARPDEV